MEFASDFIATEIKITILFPKITMKDLKNNKRGDLYNCGLSM